MRSEKLVCRRHHCAFHRLGITLYFASSPPQEALCTTAGHSMKSFIAATGESWGAWSEAVSFCGATPAGSVSMTGAGAPEIHDLPLDSFGRICLSLVTLIPSSVGSATISPQRCGTRRRSASRTQLRQYRTHVALNLIAISERVPTTGRHRNMSMRSVSKRQDLGPFRRMRKAQSS